MNKIIFIGMAIITLFSSYFAMCIITYVPAEVAINPVIQQTVEQDPVILAKLNSIGAKYTDSLNLKYLDDLNDIPGMTQPVRDTVIGMFVMYGNTNTIYVKTGVDPNRELTNITHEYLHYIWYRFISKSEQDAIISTSQPLIDADWYLSGYMEYRKGHGTYTKEEIFPVICTERPDKYILTMLETCNKYIDRSKLTFLYN